MRAGRQVARWESRAKDRKLGCDHPSRGKLTQWKDGKGAIGIGWTHDYAGVLAHIPESLVKQLLGRIEVHACG